MNGMIMWMREQPKYYLGSKYKMPGLRKAMKKILKRAGKRRNYRRGKKNVIVNTSKALAPIAQRYITTLKYCQTYKPVNSFGLNNWQIRLNSIFDPDLTGSGHQPYGRDTFSTLYARYRVVKCNYAIQAYSTDGLPVCVSALPANESHLFSSVSEARENPRAKFIVQAGTGSELKTLRGSVYLPSLMGRTSQQYMSDDRYQSTMGTNPAENAILNIQAMLIDENLLINPSVVYVVTLKYTVEFFDLINQVQS